MSRVSFASIIITFAAACTQHDDALLNAASTAAIGSDATITDIGGAGSDSTDTGGSFPVICDASGTICFVGSGGMESGDACAAGSGSDSCSPPDGMTHVTFKAIDKQTYSRTTTKSFKTSYSVVVGPTTKSGDNLANLSTKFDQTIAGYFEVDQMIANSVIAANNNKPLIGAGGLLEYDVTVTCGATTKLVSTTVTGEGDVATLAVGIAGSLKFSESGAGLSGPDSTLLGFSVGGQKVNSVENGKTAELTVSSAAERSLALKKGDNPLAKCQEKHFLKDAWGPNQNLMQFAIDSAVNFLDTNGAHWTLTSNTAVVCSCKEPVKTSGGCKYIGSDGEWHFPTGAPGYWPAPWPAAVATVVQQFDEAALLNCATFSQGDKRQTTVDGLNAECTAFNRADHDTLDKLVFDRCNANPGAYTFKGGKFWKECGNVNATAIAKGTITCAVERQ